jgi:hypothetical protein
MNSVGNFAKHNQKPRLLDGLRKREKRERVVKRGEPFPLGCNCCALLVIKPDKSCSYFFLKSRTMEYYL